MNTIKTIALKWGGAVASLALVLGVSSVQAACAFWFHQPEVPAGMEKFKR